MSIHRHYTGDHGPAPARHRHAGRLRREPRRAAGARPGPATAEALGYIRSFRPPRGPRALPGARRRRPAEVRDAGARSPAATGDLEPLPLHGGDLLSATRAYRAGAPATAERLRHRHRAGGDPRVALRLPAPTSELVRLKAGLLREPNVVVTDVPVVVQDRCRRGVEARPLIPQRTVTLVFVSSVNDATIRAVNYARSLGRGRDAGDLLRPRSRRGAPLGAAVVRPAAGHPAGHRRGAVPRPDRPDAGGGPPVHRAAGHGRERRDPGVPGATSGATYLLHNQNALFIKRLFLFEERAVLSSVPFIVEDPRHPHRAESIGGRRWIVTGGRVLPREVPEGDHGPAPDLRGGRDASARRPVRRGSQTCGADRALPRPGPGSHRRRRARATRSSRRRGSARRASTSAS